jgi:hypothetical protein
LGQFQRSSTSTQSTGHLAEVIGVPSATQSFGQASDEFRRKRHRLVQKDVLGGHRIEASLDRQLLDGQFLFGDCGKDKPPTNPEQMSIYAPEAVSEFRAV